VEVVTFQAAQERDAAFASGAVDAFMGDIIAAAALEAGGSSVSLATVMLGGDGRGGPLRHRCEAETEGPDTQGPGRVPVGTSSASIQEWVFDALMADAGVPADQVKKEVVAKVPARYELLMSGKLEAASLPEPLLSLAEKQGDRAHRR